MEQQLAIPTTNEDELWLFERTARRLEFDYGHSKAEAIRLVNAYYRKFTDPVFCALHNMSAQNAEFFAREESLLMADRIQYYEALGHPPDEQAFTQWHRAQRMRQRGNT